MISVPLSILSGSIVQCWVINCQSSAEVLQTQGDLLWISQSVGRELQTADSDRCSLSAPSSHRRTVIMVYSFIQNSLKTLKGKEVSRRVDMNQAFLYIQYSNPCLIVNGLQCTFNEGNHARCGGECVNVDTLSDSLRNDMRPIMRVFLKGIELWNGLRGHRLKWWMAAFPDCLG